MRKLLVGLASAALLSLAFAVPAQAKVATCTISDSTPDDGEQARVAVGEQVTISADGLHAGGQTHIYIIESDGVTQDLYNQGSVDTFTFNWAFGHVGEARVLFTSEKSGAIKCEVDATVV